MAQELRTSLVIDLAGNLQAQGQRYIDSLRGLGRAGTEAGAKMEAGFQAAGGSVNWLISRYTGLAGVLAIGAIAQQAAKLGENFQRLAGELGRPIEEIRELAAYLNAIAGRHDITIETGSLREAATQIAEITKDIEFVKNNAPAIGQALQMAGPGHESEIAQMFIGIQRQGIKDPQAVAHSMDKLRAQSLLPGSGMLFKDVLGSGAVMAGLLGSGKPGEEALLEMGAVLQAATKGVRGRGGIPGPAAPRMATMAFFSELQSAHVQEEMLKHGVNILDSEGHVRPLSELVPEFGRSNLLDAKRNLATAGFSEVAQAPLRVWSDEWKRTGKVQSLTDAMGARGEGGMAEESARLAGLAAVQERRFLDRVKNTAAGKWEEGVQATADEVRALEGGKPLQALKISAAHSPAARALDFLNKRYGAEREHAPEAPQGKITIEVKAAAGTSARVVGRPEASGLDLDVDSGKIMTGP